MSALSFRLGVLLRISAILVFGLILLQACKSEQETPAVDPAAPSTSQSPTTNPAALSSQPSVPQSTQPSTMAFPIASTAAAGTLAQLASPVQCQKGTINVAKTLFTIAEGLEGVDYTQNPPEALQDCSGMFHRMVQKFSDTCPGYELPSHKMHRQSVAIGKWYAERNLFTVVTDPLQQSHLITEGAVLFYGHQQKRYTARELGSSQEAVGKINHLGVVVKTEKRDGVVIQYHLFHGRRPGKKSAITAYHYRQPRSTPDFPFGNGAEQLIGVAPFVSGAPTL